MNIAFRVAPLLLSVQPDRRVKRTGAIIVKLRAPPNSGKTHNPHGTQAVCDTDRKVVDIPLAYWFVRSCRGL